MDFKIYSFDSKSDKLNYWFKFKKVVKGINNEVFCDCEGMVIGDSIVNLAVNYKGKAKRYTAPVDSYDLELVTRGRKPEGLDEHVDFLEMYLKQTYVRPLYDTLGK